LSINKVAKGARKEKACADELKAQGYTQIAITMKKKRKNRKTGEVEIKDIPVPLIWKVIRVMHQSLDIFGLFDVVALHPEGEHMLFIQTKSNRCDTETRDAIAKLKMPPSCQKWIWIWKDRKYWVKEFYD
jgi:hypothetical protein